MRPLSRRLTAVTCPQVSESTGFFELQLESVENVNGELADGECCDGPRGPQDLRCTRDECDTYFRVCLKEYQVEAAPSGACTFGAGSTPVLGGNMLSFRSSRSQRGDEAGRILIPFQFAWPVSSCPPIPPPSRTGVNRHTLAACRCGQSSPLK